MVTFHSLVRKHFRRRGQMSASTTALDIDKEPIADHPAREPRGIPPSRWGGAAWTFIHYVALGYPRHPSLRDIDEYTRFFASLQYILPCRACREHLHEHVRHTPPDEALASGRDAVFAWTVKLHNAVNESLGRPEMSVKDALRWYCKRKLVVVPASWRWTDALAGAIVALALIVAVGLLQAHGRTFLKRSGKGRR